MKFDFFHIKSVKPEVSAVSPKKTTGRSIMLALVQLIDDSSLQLGKHMRAKGLGTILLTIMLIVSGANGIKELRCLAPPGATVCQSHV
jgi:hypothetical protein